MFLFVVFRAQADLNNLKGMYQALFDLVDLLTHENADILAAVCLLIEETAKHDNNLRMMIDAGLIDNLTNLVSTVSKPPPPTHTHTNISAQDRVIIFWLIDL